MNKPVTSEAKKASKLTPMMAQYMTIKKQAGEQALLFYRMGDFYELFFDDAVRASAALDIALTKRGKHEGQDIPMCGVPVHAAETYLQRLIKKGFRVAVCEQTESPAEAKKRGYKSVVHREIVRLVTPGTLTEDTLLDARGSNFLAALFISPGGSAAISWADVSDGQFWVMATDRAGVPSVLSAISPRELIIAESLYKSKDHENLLSLPGLALTPLPKAKFDAAAAETRLKARFDVATLDGHGAFEKTELSAAGALLDYIELTQAGARAQLAPPQRIAQAGYMAIDPATRASLEITKSQQGGKAGSLLGAIDRTVTGPGARELSDRLMRPLVNVAAIKARLDAVSFFEPKSELRDALRAHLKQAGDPGRAMSRIALGRGGPRDLLTISTALKTGEAISALFVQKGLIETPPAIEQALCAISLAAQPHLGAWTADMAKAFKPDVPMMARDGGFIAPGYSADLDRLTTLRTDSRKHIAALQARYSAQTGVPTLKIKHNNVLGYFIEVTPRHGDVLMGEAHKADFIHRQTLVSAIRFTTTELADLDAQISSAGDKALALELELFERFTAQICKLADTVRSAAYGLAVLDVHSGLAVWAEEVDAVRPVIDDSAQFEIIAGRHPVVEAALKRSGAAGFTANDCALDADGQSAERLTLITGPNMAGKSTYLRQNALMFVLAQAGSFVPASKAHIGICDSLFSRVGASDDLSRGRSTFMLEMIETAAILNQSGARSFVILDEIGRGTSTFDGLSIAWATAEHLHEVNGCRALFATHYHELTELIEALPHAGNASLRAKEWDGDLVFLHDVTKGAADKSYGIQVAKLAGLPRAATARAREVLGRLEQEQDGTGAIMSDLPLFSSQSHAAAITLPSESDKILSNLDVDALSPREALDLLYELKAVSKHGES